MKRHGMILRVIIIMLSMLTLAACAHQAEDNNRNPDRINMPVENSDNPESETHTPASEPQMVKDEEPGGYCGNTITKILLDDETYSFWGDDSVALTDMLLHLNYADGLCRCPVEFTVDTEFDDGSGYGVNLESAFVRHGENQCPLTSEQIEEIQGIVDRNCVEPIKLED